MGRFHHHPPMVEHQHVDAGQLNFAIESSTGSGLGAIQLKGSLPTKASHRRSEPSTPNRPLGRNLHPCAMALHVRPSQRSGSRLEQ